jgi:hypothetical protein
MALVMLGALVLNASLSIMHSEMAEAPEWMICACAAGDRRLSQE